MPQPALSDNSPTSGPVLAADAKLAPLSYQQEGLWLASQLSPDSPFYNNIVGLRLRGALDPDVLQRSLDEIVRRHDALRTTFQLVDGRPMQLIAPRGEARLRLLHLAPDGREASEVEALERAEQEARRPLDLVRGPLIRPTLLRIAPDDHLLIVTLHHLIADGWSVSLLLKELTVLYSAIAGSRPVLLPEPRLQYCEYAAQQRERLHGQRLERELAHWKEELDGAPQFLELPTDRPRPAVHGQMGATYVFHLRPALVERLKEYCRAESVTLFVVLLAAFQTVLHRYSGQDDVLVGTPITNRLRSELEEVFGYFLNMVVIRADFSGDPSFRSLLGRLKKTVLGAYSHLELPFDKLLEALRPRRDPSRSPIFQVAFALQGGPTDALRLPELSIPGLDMEPLEIAPGASKYDLTLCMFDQTNGLSGHLEYRSDLFEEQTVARMAGHLETLLEAAVGDPEQTVSRLPMLSPQERSRILHDWNDTATDFPANRCIHELFEEQVDRTPDSVAIVVDRERWTYAELDSKANQLAHRLRRLGVGAEQMVAIALDRSAQLAVALLAVIKAGGAYVALDPTHPKERLAFQLRDAGAVLLLTEDKLIDQLPPGRPTLSLDGEQASIAEESKARPANAALPRNLAYAVYTSGSTGAPKAVAVEHRSAVSLIRWSQRAYGRQALTGILAASSACFDCTPFELFAPLSCGGTAVICESPLDLPTLPSADEVRLVSTVPSVIVELLKEAGLPASVRTMNLAGEALSQSLVRQVYESTGVERLYNLYGPSEATTFATRSLVTPLSGRVTIGRPISNTRAYILDRNLELAPVGVPGQLCLGGEGVARGYLHKARLTAERFLPDPFSGKSGARLYVTGDLARYLPNGEIEFIGRLDDQVKVHGIRVEPGEVQAALAAHPDVREAVVVPERGPDGVELLAYVLPKPGAQLSAAGLRSFIRERLPVYMTPSAFVLVEAFKLAKNGKIDRRALPSPDKGGRQPYAPPRTPEEQILAGIWEEVLGIDRVGLQDSFFDLGGHSLLAAQVVSRTREALGVELPLSALFETNSLEELAERARQGTRREQERPIERVPRTQPLPLSFAQQRLWFLEQFNPGNIAYNVPLALGLRGQLDRPALQAALNEIVRRHESLRTQFHSQMGRPVQAILPELRLELPLVDAATEPGGRQAAVNRLAVADVMKPFDLARDPLVRARLLRLGPDDHVLVLVLHHIVTDGWSMGVIREELERLYRAFSAGLPSPLEEPRIQYADFAAWQRLSLEAGQLQEQLDYWRQRLDGLPPVLELPTDRPRPAVRGLSGATRLFKVPPALTTALRRLSRQEGSTLFMTLLAVFKVLLHRYGGQPDVWVGTPISGRSRVELEPLVGFFGNTLVLRSEAGGNPSFRQLLRAVKNGTLEAFANQDLPFEWLVEELHLRRDLSHPPLFQVMFTLQNARRGDFRLEGVEVENVALENPTAKFDLDLTMVESDDFLYGGLNYSTELFDSPTVKRMLRHFQNLLEEVTADPDRGIDELPFLRDPERRRLLTGWCRGPGLTSPTVLTHELVQLQAERRPDAVAVVGEGSELTYGDLERRANQLAHCLRELGVKPDDRVALCLERSPAMVVGLLGVLKAGGAYVPLDPGYPADRLAHMLTDSKARILVTEDAPQAAVPGPARHIVRMDADGRLLAQRPESEPPSSAGLEDLAYVIYTSGSTGRPKGVSVSHGALGNLLASFAGELAVSADDVMLAVTSLSFDIAGLELLLPLVKGARTVIASEAAVADGPRLMRLLESSGATLLQATPVTWRLLLDSGWRGSSALTALCGGETLPPELGRRLLERCGRLYNLYGPTETTIWSTAARLERERPLSIGRPIANTEVYVLDQRLEPLPAGIPGELYIGGSGLARGYLGRPDLTAERFVPHPLGNAGERLYRTGDLARFRADGSLEYLGRLDRQVKLRGFRIELEEVESALGAHPEVADAVVTAPEDGSGDRRLVAYLVSGSGRVPSAAELRAHLRKTLPEYMLPASFVQLDALPRTPNGKVDRRVLPVADGASPRGPDRVPPRDEDEVALASIWSEVLEVNGIGVHDDFFELGGQSLLATQVTARLREELDLDLPLRLVFRAPTIAQFAQLLRVARANGGEWPPDADLDECLRDPETAVGTQATSTEGSAGRWS